MIKTPAQKSQEKAKGYSIWLLPDDKSTHLLQGTIDTLSARFHSPVFQPHITLLGQLEGDQLSIMGSFNMLCKGVHPFMLGVRGIAYQNVFFRSMFCELSETGELMALNQLARERYGRETDKAYFPHLSLLYSHKSEAEKQTAVKSLKPQYPDLMTIASFALVKTQGEVGDWELLKRFELS
ncbi:MAG: hypothetical protein K9M49_06125 [Candidatus Marinimicrobia bacterium]|nr:hypothetical protein [Candidatus Neomarinimicrobiota bacterium]MCF7904712.1 hypothetical protein [Candidatus Neomarinimicrobiota bacterium]